MRSESRSLPASHAGRGRPRHTWYIATTNVTVSAFSSEARVVEVCVLGIGFDTKDRRIVISGDTAPTEEVVRACDGVRCVAAMKCSIPKRKKIVESKQKQGLLRGVSHTSPFRVGRDCYARRPSEVCWCFITR